MASADRPPEQASEDLSPREETRVLVVDEHAVVRDGVRSIVAENFPRPVFGEAGTAEEAQRLVQEKEWEVVVLDPALGGQLGLELVTRLKQSRPGLPILVLSVHTEEQYARRAFRAGASAYVTKDSPRAQLVDALRRVLQGGRYASPVITEQMIANLTHRGEGPLHSSLSDREFEVLGLLASGKTVREIAEQLSLSNSTVSTYRARLLKKMGLKNNAALMHYAIQNRLFGDP